MQVCVPQQQKISSRGEEIAVSRFLKMFPSDRTYFDCWNHKLDQEENGKISRKKGHTEKCTFYKQAKYCAINSNWLVSNTEIANVLS